MRLAKVEQTQVVLFLFVDLHVTVVSHDSLVQAARCQSIGGDEVKHVFVLEFADRGLLVAENVGFPRLVEQELLDAQDAALVVDLVVLEALVAEADEGAAGHEEHALVVRALANDSLSRFEFDRAHRLDDKTLISFLDSLQEGPHSSVLEIEIFQLFGHDAVDDVLDGWVLLDAVHVEVQGLHGVLRRNLHYLENLDRKVQGTKTALTTPVTVTVSR